MTYAHKSVLLGAFALSLLTLGFALPAEAEYNRSALMQGTNASSTSDHKDKMSSSTKDRGDKMSSSTPKVDGICIQKAVDARETSVSSAWTVFSAAITSSLSARKASLYAAWGMTDVKARNAALKTAFTDWSKAKKSAHEVLRKARMSAWETFKKTAKDICKVSVPKDDTMGTDAKGSVTI